MSAPKAHEAQELLERAQRDSERFEAFVYGYVHGAQDMDSDTPLIGEEAFEERVKELYRDEYPESFI